MKRFIRLLLGSGSHWEPMYRYDPSYHTEHSRTRISHRHKRPTKLDGPKLPIVQPKQPQSLPGAMLAVLTAVLLLPIPALATITFGTWTTSSGSNWNGSGQTYVEPTYLAVQFEMPANTVANQILGFQIPYSISGGGNETITLTQSLPNYSYTGSTNPYNLSVFTTGFAHSFWNGNPSDGAITSSNQFSSGTNGTLFVQLSTLANSTVSASPYTLYFTYSP